MSDSGPKPQFDRYAYWEKFDYWAVFWGMIVIGFSGYAMWFAPFFARFLPGWALNAVLVIHSEEGLLAILFIFSIHFVNTHLRPDSFPMDMVVFTGVESEEEFKHKRPLEYERLVKDGKLEARLGEAPQTFAGEFFAGGGNDCDRDRIDSAGSYVDGVFQLNESVPGSRHRRDRGAPQGDITRARKSSLEIAILVWYARPETPQAQ